MNRTWKESSFSGHDGCDLFCRVCDCPQPRHTLVILPGYGEHSGRYLKFADALQGLPVRIAVMDYRGMGILKTNSEEGKDFEDFLEDVSAFVRYLKNTYHVKDKWVFLGHSLGGLIALEWVQRNSDGVKRLILSAPFLGFPHLELIRHLNNLVRFFCPTYEYQNPVMPKRLSHDPAESRAYAQDPLIKRRISARLIGSIFDAIRNLNSRKTMTVACPVNILAAGNERIVAPRAVRRFFDRLVAPGKEFTLLEGFYHEIFNEIVQAKAFNVLKTILEDCV
ncbi:MAG TPA: lysophospholipase [Candidatus Omnitrophota bacterium]|nr:lysophospholipase [Candidatus Omnitrophota bacterium]